MEEKKRGSLLGFRLNDLSSLSEKERSCERLCCIGGRLRLQERRVTDTEYLLDNREVSEQKARQTLQERLQAAKKRLEQERREAKSLLDRRIEELKRLGAQTIHEQIEEYAEADFAPALADNEQLIAHALDEHMHSSVVNLLLVGLEQRVAEARRIVYRTTDQINQLEMQTIPERKVQLHAQV